MKVLLDTNVLLDYLLNRGNAQAARKLLKLSNAKFIQACVTDLTIANIAYITRKSIPQDSFYEVMKTMQKFYAVIPIGENVVNRAIEEKWKDFEDCLQSLAAEQAGAEAIITSNAKDFQNSRLNIYAPDDFLLLFEGKNCITAE